MKKIILLLVICTILYGVQIFFRSVADTGKNILEKNNQEIEKVLQEIK